MFRVRERACFKAFPEVQIFSQRVFYLRTRMEELTVIVIRCLGLGSVLVLRLFLKCRFFPKGFFICAPGFSLEGVWGPPL